MGAEVKRTSAVSREPAHKESREASCTRTPLWKMKKESNRWKLNTNASFFDLHIIALIIVTKFNGICYNNFGLFLYSFSNAAFGDFRNQVGRAETESEYNNSQGRQ